MGSKLIRKSGWLLTRWQLVRIQPVPRCVTSVSYNGSVRPSFKRVIRVRFPSRILVRSVFCPRRTMAQYARLSNGQYGFDSRRGYQALIRTSPTRICGFKSRRTSLHDVPSGWESIAACSLERNLAARAGHHDRSFRYVRWFDSIGCDFSRAHSGKPYTQNTWFNSKTVHLRAVATAAVSLPRKIPIVAFQLGRAEHFPLTKQQRFHAVPRVRRWPSR